MSTVTWTWDAARLQCSNLLESLDPYLEPFSCDNKAYERSFYGRTHFQSPTLFNYELIVKSDWTWHYKFEYLEGMDFAK